MPKRPAPKPAEDLRDRKRIAAAQAAGTAERLAKTHKPKPATVAKPRKAVSSFATSNEAAKMNTPRFTFPDPMPDRTPEKVAREPGTYRLEDLGFEQCRYPTSGDRPVGGHRFCGEPAPISADNRHGSWCEHHRGIVFGKGTAGERAAVPGRFANG